MEHTSDKLANPSHQIKDALENVGEKPNKPGKQVRNPHNERMHYRVHGADDGSGELVDGCEEVGYGGGDGHFFFSLSGECWVWSVSVVECCGLVGVRVW